jgi:hypothetical protein
MAEMSEQAISAVSTIPLVLGSILMLAAGFGFTSSNDVIPAGFTSSNDVIPAGVVCFTVAVFIKGILKKTRTTP